MSPEWGHYKIEKKGKILALGSVLSQCAEKGAARFLKCYTSFCKGC